MQKQIIHIYSAHLVMFMDRYQNSDWKILTLLGLLLENPWQEIKTPSSREGLYKNV